MRVVAGRSSLERSVLFLVSCLALVLGTAVSFGLRLNLSGSLPIGLYRLTRGAHKFDRGAIVLTCLEPPMSTLAHDRGYVPRGGHCAGGLVPIGKVIVAVPGDIVRVTHEGLIVNGRPVPHSRALERDRNGRALPRLASGKYLVQPHRLWLVGRSDLSFDSRYIGDGDAAHIVARVSPLWTATWADRAVGNK
jgi:conjugative transfer signal peptidase TraF